MCLIRLSCAPKAAPTRPGPTGQNPAQLPPSGCTRWDWKKAPLLAVCPMNPFWGAVSPDLRKALELEQTGAVAVFAKTRPGVARDWLGNRRLPLIAGAGECGPRNIGNSMLVDPLGIAVARAAEAPALIFADIDPARIAYARSVLPVLENRRFEAHSFGKADA